jgi:hypothetical protein
MSRVSAMEVRPPSEASPAHVTEAPPLWRRRRKVSLAISHQQRNSESGLTSHDGWSCVPTVPGKPPSPFRGGRLADRNPPWLGCLGFGQRQGEHTIIE